MNILTWRFRWAVPLEEFKTEVIAEPLAGWAQSGDDCWSQSHGAGECQSCDEGGVQSFGKRRSKKQQTSSPNLTW